MSSAPERTARDVTGLLNSAGHALSHRLNAALTEIGLTEKMQCVLVHALEEERTQIQLAALADLDKTTMVGVVDELERRGFATRQPSRTDRRARIIAVTEAGRQAAQQGQDVVDRVHAEALAGLPEEVRTVFVRALAQLVDDNREAGPRSVRRARQSVR
jgi:MarR family transcriptional regulator, transcriptional regulator for hemolysin